MKTSILKVLLATALLSLLILPSGAGAIPSDIFMLKNTNTGQTFTMEITEDMEVGQPIFYFTASGGYVENTTRNKLTVLYEDHIDGIVSDYVVLDWIPGTNTMVLAFTEDWNKISGIQFTEYFKSVESGSPVDISYYLDSGSSGAGWKASFWSEVDAPLVPEPATMFLLGSGLLGLVWLRRKLNR